MAGLGRVEPLPQVGILDRLLLTGAPAVALPALDPRADTLLEILRIGMDIDDARTLQRLQRRNRSHQLHTVVGGRGLAAGPVLATRTRRQGRAPPAGPRIARAAAVRVDGDRGLGRHGSPATPYSLAPLTLRWNLSRRRNSLGSLRLTSALLDVCSQS